MARLLQGKPVVEAMGRAIEPDIARCRAAGVEPTLAIVRVGERLVQRELGVTNERFSYQVKVALAELS